MLIWSSVSLLDNWLAAFIVVIACGIWMSPFIGWFLLVSAYTKRSPLLMAFMPLLLIGLLEGIILRSHVFAENVLARGDGLPLFRTGNIERFFDEERWRISEDATSLLVHLDVAQFLTSPGMWAGVLVCGLLSTGAIYVRRFRDES
jgi:ABC-2 type transport system permease protein